VLRNASGGSDQLQTVLRKLLATAVEWGVLNSIPRIKWLRTPPGEFDFLTYTEVDRLLECAAGEWRALIVVAVRTGMRQGELRALRWLDVDLNAGRLVVRRAAWKTVVASPKNGRMREIALNAQAESILRQHPRRSEWVFSSGAGTMLSKGEMKWPLWSACDRANLRRIGWHTLRHTFASHLVMRGAPLKAVQELLGHSTIEMTMRYSHLTPDARREAIRLLDFKELPAVGWTTSTGSLIQMPLLVGGHKRSIRHALVRARFKPPTGHVASHVTSDGLCRADQWATMWGCRPLLALT